MISWQQVTETGLSTAYFSGFQNNAPGLLTRIAVNMRPIALRSTLPDSVKTEEKFFYCCVGCKTTDQEKLIAVFQTYNPNQSIVTTPLRYDNEIGFILWLPSNAEAKRSVEEFLETISNSEKLGEKGLPEIIKEQVQNRVMSYLDAEKPV